jgi:hypothetical protein
LKTDIIEKLGGEDESVAKIYNYSNGAHVRNFKIKL